MRKLNRILLVVFLTSLFVVLIELGLAVFQLPKTPRNQAIIPTSQPTPVNSQQVSAKSAIDDIRIVRFSNTLRSYRSDVLVSSTMTVTLRGKLANLNKNGGNITRYNVPIKARVIFDLVGSENTSLNFKFTDAEFSQAKLYKSATEGTPSATLADFNNGDTIELVMSTNIQNYQVTSLSLRKL